MKILHKLVPRCVCTKTVKKNSVTQRLYWDFKLRGPSEFSRLKILIAHTVGA